MTTAWPVKLEFQRGRKQLHIAFDDDRAFSIPFATLRRQSPSAELRGHGAGPRPPAPVIADDLTVERADPVGRYAVRIHFSDGHSSGLFTWSYLRELGERHIDGTA